MTNLFDPPPIFTLPVSKGGDLFFGFIYKPLVVDQDGNPVLDEGGNKQYVEADYPDGSSVTLVIETGGDPITVDAGIDGSMATVQADYLVADTIKDRSLWRAIISYSNGLDQVLCNGTVSRSDGKVR